MKKNNTITLTYNVQNSELLDWMADSKKLNEGMSWIPRIEIAIDNNSYPDSSFIYIDVEFTLTDKSKIIASRIAVRTIVSTDKSKDLKYSTSIIGFFLHNAIALTRGMFIWHCNQSNIILPLIPYYTYKRLEEFASLALYKPTISALTYEQKKMPKEFIIPLESDVVLVKVGKVIPLWWVSSKKQDDDSGNHEDINEENTLNIKFNLDYYRKTEKDWELYLDFGMLSTTRGRINVRSCYEAECNDEELFSAETLDVVCDDAFRNCLEQFNKQCRQEKMEEQEDTFITDEFISGFRDMALDIYYNNLKHVEISNKAMLVPGLTMTQGGNTRLIVKATFMILDEVLFSHPHFDSEHNIQVLKEAGITEPWYYTLKQTCMEIEKSEIQLSFLHAILFYLCIDIALQLLVSEHGDTLQPVLERNNLTKFRQEEFLKFGNSYLEGQNNQMKENGVTVENLKERKDWGSIIR